MTGRRSDSSLAFLFRQQRAEVPLRMQDAPYVDVALALNLEYEKGESAELAAAQALDREKIAVAQ